jgi:hypothetical protein
MFDQFSSRARPSDLYDERGPKRKFDSQLTQARINAGSSIGAILVASVQR